MDMIKWLLQDPFKGVDPASTLLESK